MYAIDDLGDAVDVTRDFLTPLDAKRWLKLAIVVFFIGGFGGFSPSSAPTGGDPTGTAPGEVSIPSPDVLVVLALIVAIAIVIWLIFGLLGSLLEFVLIDSLRSGSVSILSGLSENFGNGLRLFGFRTALGVLSLAAVGVPAYLTFWPLDSIETVPLSTIWRFFALAIVVFFAFALVSRLTTEFVVPTMLAEDRGVLSAWGRFWVTLRQDPGEYIVYLVLVTIVSIAAAIGLGIVSIFVTFVVAIPFVILGVILAMLGPVGLVLLIPLVIVAIVTLLLIQALIQMPLVVFVRYYALLVLGDTDSELDLIPDRRRAVRSGTDWDGDESWAGAPDDDSSDDATGWDRSDDTADGSGTDDESDWGYRN